jgi:anti-anti-sigma regulatory factor
MDQGEISGDQDREGKGASASSAPFVCPERLDVAASAELRLALLTQLAMPGDLAVDIGAVAYVDTAGVQLLCAAARAAQGKGARVTWIGGSGVLAAAARQLGVEEVLGLRSK